MKASRLSALLLAAALAAPVAQAQAEHHGPYLVAAAGRSQIHYDCGYFFDCSGAKSTTGKIVGGYRFGVFAMEAWYADFGKVDTSDVWSGPRDLRVRSFGVGGAWHLHFGEQ
jgi:hypothetical protein